LNDALRPRISPEAAPKSARQVIALCALTTLVVALESNLLPVEWSATAVGFTFLVVTYQLAVAGRSDEMVRHHGLSLGGLLESAPLSAPRIINASVSALGWALGIALLIFPPFGLGFHAFWRPDHAFVFAPWPSFANDAMGQLLVVALPEEAFYRGYVQTALDDIWKKRIPLLGGYLSPGLVVSSALFALGHVLTEPHPNRLAVFFPSLLFGWLRTRTNSIGPSMSFHALCNLYSAYLGRCFSLWA
jgi:membrane protease YdiL (CAAX protease family)